MEVKLTINDTNTNDTHVIEWDLPEYLSAEISANQLSVYLTPENIVLPDDVHNLISMSVKVTDDGSERINDNIANTTFISVPLLNSQARLTTTDTDRDGVSDLEEGFSDDDLDGLPAYLDNSTVPYIQPLHVNASVVKLMETEPELSLTLGKYARLQLSDGVQLSEQELMSTGLVTEDTLIHQDEYFDFIINDLDVYGSSAYVVIPLQNAIAKNSVYRKYSLDNGWQDFVVDANNAIASSADVNGVCPAPHSDLYSEGLTLGHLCLRLYIEDGGANDADGIANGSIDDPGGLGTLPSEVIAKQTDPESTSSGSITWGSLFIIFVLIRRKLSVKLIKTNECY